MRESAPPPLAGSRAGGSESGDLAERVAALHWYHTLELPGGVLTPGWFDTRGALRHVPLPARLDGLRCLDVGTWDGFWAFEMERRGAAHVTAIDIDDPGAWDWPPRMMIGDGNAVSREILGQFKSQAAAFQLAHELLGSQVERLDLSVYELDPAIHGQFDCVFVGSLLLHLRDPVGALARLREVCAGELIVADAVEAVSSWLRPRTPTVRLEGVDRPWWWLPNVAALAQMASSAGFDVLERTGVYYVRLGKSHPRSSARTRLRHARSPAGREKLIAQWRGLPHAALRARPLAG